jgi:hypothetical protein
MQNEIYQFIRKKKTKEPVGILLAHTIDEKVFIGFSKCNTKYDKFKKDVGINIAVGKSVELKNKERVDIPYCIKDDLPKFINRCYKYYKDREMPKWSLELL